MPHEAPEELEWRSRYASCYLYANSSGVSWGELTSSKLQAHSYEEAGKQVLIPYPLSLIPSVTIDNPRLLSYNSIVMEGCPSG